MLAIISFVILFSYTAYYLSRVGLLPSHSDSYLALGKQGWMFQASLFCFWSTGYLAIRMLFY